MRERTNVGEMMPSRTPSPAPSPWVNVVLPAPSSPLSSRRSPGLSTPPIRAASARVASASRVPSSAVQTGWALASDILRPPGPLHVEPGNAWRNPCDDLVVDGVRGRGPVVGRRAVTAEEDSFAAHQGAGVFKGAEVDDELV